MGEFAHLKAPCQACKKLVEPGYVGTASGRPHFECSCGNKWVGKNAAAAALGRLGAKVRNDSLNSEQRTASAEHAANARWMKHKLAKNKPSKPRA